MLGDPIRQQVGGTIRSRPVSAAVMILGEVDASRSVGVAVNEHEFAIAVAVVMCSFAMLPHGESQASASPASVGIEFARTIEQFVGDIEQREMPGSAAVMSVITDQAEVGRSQPILSLELGDDLADELIGTSDRSPRRAELASAFFVADGIGFREPHDHDRLLTRNELSHGVVRIRIVDVLPSVVRFEIRHRSSEAAAPKWRRRFGHDGQHSSRPVAAFAAQKFVQRSDVAGQRVFPSVSFMVTVNPFSHG